MIKYTTYHSIGILLFNDKLYFIPLNQFSCLMAHLFVFFFWVKCRFHFNVGLLSMSGYLTSSFRHNCKGHSAGFTFMRRTINHVWNKLRWACKSDAAVYGRRMFQGFLVCGESDANGKSSIPSVAALIWVYGEVVEIFGHLCRVRFKCTSVL